MALRYIAYYYTTNSETLFSTQWSTESGQGIHKENTMPSNSHVQYCFLYISGFQNGSSYNVVIQRARVNDSFQLRQAYVQGASGNIDVINSFSGDAVNGYTANFDINWGDGASRIVLYFENPNPDTVISNLTYDATYINAINIGNGSATATANIDQNTADIDRTTTSIKNDTYNIFQKIAALPQALYDKMLALFQ